MEFFTFILLVLIIFLLVSLNNTVKKFIKEQKHNNRVLYNAIERISKPKEEETEEKIKAPPIPHAPTSPIIIPVPPKPVKKIPEVVKQEKVESLSRKEEILAKDESGKWPVLESKTEKPKVVAARIKPKKKERKSFLEKHPDIEKFIGENLINKIGIVILVLGIAFSVKYAIDKNWINEIGRVAIGIFSAGILIGLAHRLRKNYAAFSSVLIGGGLAILYFTITLAFHTPGYPLYGQQTITFAILIFITIFAVLLSLLYNRMEIAILALVGGFGSPLMVSTGSGNYIVLFSYLTLLNVGMLSLSYYKKWRAINIIAFIATTLLFGSWLGGEVAQADYSKFSGAVFFATGFYIIFFLMNIIYNLKNSISFKAGEITLLLSNTFIYFSFMMTMLSFINEGAYKGIFSILLAAFNFGFAYYINASKKTDSNLLFLLIGLVFTFVTLAIPLQLEGNYITLFWAVEAVLLLWLGQRSGFDIMKLGSIIVSFLMLISLGMDLNNGYSIVYLEDGLRGEKLGLFFNKLFLTSLLVIASLLASLKLLKKEKDVFAWIIPTKEYRLTLFILSLITMYIGGFAEITYQAEYFTDLRSSKTIIILLYNALFVNLLLVLAAKFKKREFSVVVTGITAFFIVFFLSALGTEYYQNLFLYIGANANVPLSIFVFRWLSIIVVLLNSTLLFGLIKGLNTENSLQIYRVNFSFFILTILIVLSTSLDAIALITSQDIAVLAKTQKVGYTILWGITSFLLMIIGMKRKIKFVRIISLILFAITIFKLFAFDIKEISEGGKIVAFILLGVLLLIISFMYQKVKRLIIDDTPISKKEN